MTDTLTSINSFNPYHTEDMNQLTIFFYRPRDHKGKISELAQRFCGLHHSGTVYSHVSVAFGYTCIDFTTDGITCTEDVESYMENYREAADVLTYRITDEQSAFAMDFIAEAAEENYYVCFRDYIMPMLRWKNKLQIREYLPSCTAPVYVTLDWLAPHPLCFFPTVLYRQLVDKQLW
jgi:hypothetical protein